MKSDRFFEIFSFAALSVVLTLSGCGVQRTVDEPSEVYYDSRDQAQTRNDQPSSAPAAIASRIDGDAPLAEPDAVDAAPDVLIRRAPESNGPLDGDAAGMVLFENVESIASCYRQAGAGGGGSGVAFVIFDVQRDGDITDAIVGHSDVRSMGFVRCIEGALGAITMPEAEGKSIVQAYLVFGAADEDEGRRMLRSYRAARAEAEERVGDAMPLTAVRNVVQGCYERIFRGRQATPGRLVLGMSLGEEGEVEEIEITEETFDGRLDQCVLASLRGLRLQLDDDASTITYPVVLQPGELISTQEDAI